mgnify:CR=1 FL=1
MTLDLRAPAAANESADANDAPAPSETLKTSPSEGRDPLTLAPSNLAQLNDNARTPHGPSLANALASVAPRVIEMLRRCARMLRRAYANLRPQPVAATLANDSLNAHLATTFARDLRTGLKMLVGGVGVLSIWAVAVPLSAAIVVGGTLVAAGNIKKVQHPNGGVTAQIFVRDGATVREGDLLVRLDETQARTNLSVVAKQLDEIRTRIARLAAERDSSSEIVPPREWETKVAGGRDADQILLAEKSLFVARTTARLGQKDLLRRQTNQLSEQVSGLNAQVKSKESQLELISSELSGIKGLYEKQLVPLTRLTALQRESARLDGERGQLQAAIAETQSKISAAELQIVRIDQDFQTDVLKELRDSREKEAELTERIVAAKDLFNRIDIRAPTSGIVHQLSVHTIGGVIAPGEVIMEIVPNSDELQIEGRLQPKDIDQARVGQKAVVRFPAFNQRTTPELDGVVSFISADLTQDRQTNSSYYTIKVVLPREQRERLGSLQLISGMPSELFLNAGSRTMMSYLLKPIVDQARRSFNQR